jgi:hypothetical protein
MVVDRLSRYRAVRKSYEEAALGVRGVIRELQRFFGFLSPAGWLLNG